jgi:hypothetical protein
MSEHTPTPWKLFHSNGTIAIKNPRSRSSHNEIVFWTGFDASHYPDLALANARFIVNAVNAHDALLAALQKIVDTDQHPDHEDTAAELREIARNAITGAVGAMPGEK